MALALSARDYAALGRLVADLLTVAGEMGYDPERDMGGPMGDSDQYVQIDASRVLNIVDYGDVAIDNLR